MINVCVLTISDRCSAGARKDDESGRRIKEEAGRAGWFVAGYRVVPDEKEEISAVLERYSDMQRADLVLTTGGTGLGGRDVTPEATAAVLEKEVPGLAEIMRIKTFDKAMFSVLSRGVAGVRGKTLIINLPGSPDAVKECLEVILPVIPHALEMIKGAGHDHE